jgi:hypothetical protein
MKERVIELRGLKRRITVNCLNFISYRGSGIPPQASFMFDYTNLNATIPGFSSLKSSNGLLSPVELPLDASEGNQLMSTPLSSKKRKSREVDLEGSEEADQSKCNCR